MALKSTEKRKAIEGFNKRNFLTILTKKSNKNYGNTSNQKRLDLSNITCDSTFKFTCDLKIDK